MKTTYARLAQEYALLGVCSEDLIRDESRATSTYEEARELKELLASEASLRSIIIVSSPYHLRRARWIFTKVLDSRAALQFAPVPFEVSRHKRRWWTSEQSLKTVVTEYLTIAFYYVSY